MSTGRAPTRLGPRFTEAVAFAIDAHGPQLRKGTSIPYAAHLLGVAAIALENGADEEQAIAALLHDVVEDCGVTVADVAARFGDRVSRMVSDCTDSFGDGEKAPWRERKEAYLAALAGKPPESLLVSVSDKIHNACAINNDLAAVGAGVWTRFKGGRDGTLWYYRALADRFAGLLPGTAARRFEAAVTEMEGLATKTA